MPAAEMATLMVASEAEVEEATGALRRRSVQRKDRINIQ
jgi:hypothetical protein